MTTKAQQAHLNLLGLLHDRIRTIYGRVHEYTRYGGKAGGRPTASTRVLHDRIVALAAKGRTRKEISAELDVSVNTVGLHLNGKIKAKR